jgi:protein-S-isoprenylcysteine O-methyltransferase Ste14
MYLAIIVALFAWCVFLLNPVALLLVFSCMYYLNRYQILPEERALTQRFPERYPEYQARVRRWF